jgi:integrin beta 3
MPPLLLADPECYTHYQGFDYRGNKNVTARGFTCQRWTSQTPHAHAYDNHRYASAGVGDHNNCRSVGSFCAWCFTVNEGKPEWDCCDIGPPKERCEILGLRYDDEARASGDTGLGLAAAGGGVPVDLPPGPPHAGRATGAGGIGTCILLAIIAAAALTSAAAAWRRGLHAEPPPSARAPVRAEGQSKPRTVFADSADTLEEGSPGWHDCREQLQSPSALSRDSDSPRSRRQGATPPVPLSRSVSTSTSTTTRLTGMTASVRLGHTPHMML